MTSVVPNDSSQTENIFDETSEDIPEFHEADTVVWDSEDDLGTPDDDETVVIALNYVNNEDVTQVISVFLIKVQQ